MFTGLITHEGTFRGFRLGKQTLAIEAAEAAARLSPGDSLAVNGVCLTLTRKSGARLEFDASRETLEKSTLGGLRNGARLNLELPATPTSFLGGHLVTGHVDGVGRVIAVAERRPGRRLIVGYPPELAPWFAPQGSVAVDGVSLTVADLGPASFDVELIPATLRSTNLEALRPGDAVNLECDIVGKYVYNFLTEMRKRGT